MFRGWWKMAAPIAFIFMMRFADDTGTHTGPIFVLGLSIGTVYAALCVLAWFQRSRAIGHWVKVQGGAPVIYSLSEVDFEATSVVTSTKIKWQAFSKIEVHDLDTLLRLPYDGTLRLPTKQVPADAMEYLMKRFAAHGKTIDDKRKRANSG